MKKNLKIIVKKYENGKFKQENSCILDFGDSKIVEKFFFLIFLPVKIYVFFIVSPFIFFHFILKAKNKLISIFNKK